MEERTILHCDCNSFFASVESINHPEYKRVPMAVCGNPENRHGIILAKNELAKKYGIVTAETVWQARKKCPQLLLVHSHHARYGEISEKINEIYNQYTDLVEPFSIDESWLDVTGTTHLFGSGEQIANELRRRISEEIGITISAGVSFNKIFAKLGSDYKKPDATTVISRENFREIVWPLPATDMMFVGRTSADKLLRYGIRTIGDIARAGSLRMSELLGKAGLTLYRYADGLECEPVRPFGERDEPKSVGNGMTFAHDLCSLDEIRCGLLPLCDEVGTRLRRHGLFCATVQLQIKDPNFRVISRQLTLPERTNATLDIYDAAIAIIKKVWVPINAPIRLLTVTAENLSGQREQQLSLFSGSAAHPGAQQIDGVMDTLRGRFGSGVISYGGALPRSAKDDKPIDAAAGKKL